MKKKKKEKQRRSDAAAGAIAKAREGVTRAGQKLADRLARLEAVADAIDTAAVERFAGAAVSELAEYQLLRDLGDLHRAFAAVPAGTLPEGIEPFRHLPEAVLRWMQSRFGLTPYLEAGKVLQVPSEKLEGFSLEGDRAIAPAGLLVRVKILAAGWKKGSEVVVPPRAEVVI